MQIDRIAVFGGFKSEICEKTRLGFFQLATSSNILPRDVAKLMHRGRQFLIEYQAHCLKKATIPMSLSRTIHHLSGFLTERATPFRSIPTTLHANREKKNNLLRGFGEFDVPSMHDIRYIPLHIPILPTKSPPHPSRRGRRPLWPP